MRTLTLSPQNMAAYGLSLLLVVATKAGSIDVRVHFKTRNLEALKESVGGAR